ncbi:MAG TPA: GNAT family N-acetyltransferase [bacterium]|nr:GNAT family N-acetyltransferase [bacterium]
MKPVIRHDPASGRFWTVVEDRESYLVYTRTGEHSIDMQSTFVDPAVRGRGVGHALVKEAVAFARSKGLDIIPTCWFVKRYLDREAKLKERQGGPNRAGNTDNGGAGHGGAS